MTAVWALASLWFGLALIASLIAIHFEGSEQFAREATCVAGPGQLLSHAILYHTPTPSERECLGHDVNRATCLNWLNEPGDGAF